MVNGIENKIFNNVRERIAKGVDMNLYHVIILARWKTPSFPVLARDYSFIVIAEHENEAFERAKEILVSQYPEFKNEVTITHNTQRLFCGIKTADDLAGIWLIRADTHGPY